MWDLWWTKRHWVRFSPSTSVSPAKHPTDCSTIIIHYHPGWYNRPVVASVIVDSVSLYPKKEKKKLITVTTPENFLIAGILICMKIRI
jgi:hypothetical protein